MKRFVSWLFVFSVIGILISATSCDSRAPISVDFNPLDSIDHRRDSTGSGGSGGNDSTICFERDILPIFLANCAMSGCHDAQSHEDGYILTSYETITAKGIVPYEPNRSEIYKVLIGQGENTIGVSPWLTLRRDDDEEDDEDDDGYDDEYDDDGDDEGDDDYRMPPPPYPPLSQDKIDLIYRWIAEGAQNTQCDSTGGDSSGDDCDTLNMSYAQDIQPILSTNCVGCHSSSAPSGGIVLDNYNSVKSVASSGRLYGSVAHLAGYKPMPPEEQLDNCSILKIKAWIDQGTPPMSFHFVHDPE